MPVKRPLILQTGPTVEALWAALGLLFRIALFMELPLALDGVRLPGKGPWNVQNRLPAVKALGGLLSPPAVATFKVNLELAVHSIVLPADFPGTLVIGWWQWSHFGAVALSQAP